MIRRMQVAGQFYPATASALRKQCNDLLKKKEKKEDALGLVSPHAGYIFSGKVAGACFSQVNLTKTIIILGPNHTGLGVPFSIMTDGTWQMPLGNVEVDSLLAKKILQASKYLEDDTQAHLYEHSIEVQLPFIQYLLPKFKMVPIILSGSDLESYNEIGKAIAKVVKEVGKEFLIIASSDMTHYEPEAEAKQKDNLAIEAILELDGEKLFQRVNKFNISMCGYGPILCMLVATKELGAKKARLVKYQTSGETSGNYSSVVGYAGIIVQ